MEFIEAKEFPRSKLVPLKSTNQNLTDEENFSYKIWPKMKKNLLQEDR
jgi:hypothetical protein